MAACCMERPRCRKLRTESSGRADILSGRPVAFAPDGLPGKVSADSSLGVTPAPVQKIGLIGECSDQNGTFCCRATLHYSRVKATKKEALAVRCPTCGARPGEKCRLGTGQPRTDPHRNRRLVA